MAAKKLTPFEGVPFDFGSPYDEGKALLVLNSLIGRLRTRLAKSTALPPIEKRGIAKPRPSASQTLPGLWDVITFRFAGKEPFTRHPHLTVWISDDTSIQIILPNDARDYWKRLTSVSDEELESSLRKVMTRVRRLRRQLNGGLWEPRLYLEVVQRHFHARRYEIEDGRLRFDLDVVFPGGVPNVKQNRAWLAALREIIARYQHANMQLALKVRFPFAERSVSRTPQFVDAGARAAQALAPFLALLIDSPRQLSK